MIPIAIVVGVSVALAACTVAVTASSRFHTSPLDLDAEQRGVGRAARRWSRLHAARRRIDRWSAGTALIVASMAVLVAVSVVVGLLLDMIDENEGLADADSAIARWGADHATETSTRIVEAVTQLGARPIVLAALAIAGFVAWRRHGNREVVLFAAAVGLGEMVVVNTLKLIVGRERPSVMQLVGAGGHSFPSGHTTAAAAAWMAIALMLGRDRSRSTRAALAGGAVAIAVAVATSRALLGVHWFTDVVAGLAVGWGWYLLVAIAFGGRRQRLGQPLRDAAPEAVAPHGGDADRSDETNNFAEGARR